ncbi:hypothetical protein U9M48_042512 [Paspalum notatum var. saurae]|uniref:Alcohol dehydrogenase-like N-terminal domain-containing protein n=1 Tax=Paspalum notatum var. saurae TaxID=547442 RepID=A0AAQ3UQP0_PASNO
MLSQRVATVTLGQQEAPTESSPLTKFPTELYEAMMFVDHTLWSLHEIVGQVTEVESEVKGINIGDHVGVGIYVNSCGDCENCNSFEEIHCPKMVVTFNVVEADGTVTMGGYSRHIVVKQRFCFKIPDIYPLAKATPLLCARSTVYTPMIRHSVSGRPSHGTVDCGLTQC